jgi:hypothetical protein
MRDAQKMSRPPLVTLDSSQSPEDTTFARLPTPSQQTFCEPCKAFLRGDTTECFGSEKLTILSDNEYIHHIDGDSFERALELPCAICIRLYKAFQRNSGIYAFSEWVAVADLSSDIVNQTGYSAGPTHYFFLDNSLLFESHGISIYPDLLPHECEKGNTFPVVYSHDTDFVVKQGLNCIINT